MNNETDETDDPREHINDHEWLYQHGYYDGTFYAASRQLQEAMERLATGLGVVWLMRKMDTGLTVAVVWWQDHVMLPLGRWLRGRR